MTNDNSKRLFRVQCYVIGNHGGHIGKRVIEVQAFNKDDAFNAARRLCYLPIKIV